MKPRSLGIRLEVLPGTTVLEKFANAQRFGFDAVELPGRFLSRYRDDLLANFEKLPLPVSSISLGFRGSLVSADPELRRECREDIRQLLALCQQLGAVGLVVPPALRQDNQQLAATSSRNDLLLAQLPELAEYAARFGTSLLLEAVNHQETDYMTTVGHAVSICERAGHHSLGVVVDFFHMQFEEPDAPAIIRRAGPWIRHIHVADRARTEPQPGGLDIRPGFGALREIGYTGYVVVECRRLSGPADSVLPATVNYLREAFE